MALIRVELIPVGAGLKVAALLNAIVAFAAGSLLFLPDGGGIEPGWSGWPVVLALPVALLGIVLGLPLSLVEVFTDARRWLGACGVVLSLTPLPLFVVLFVGVARIKGLRIL